MNDYIKYSPEQKVTINSGFPEFGYELISALPYAYFLHQKGQLKKTISGIDTACLYFFSPEHEELCQSRSWHNVAALEAAEFPNIRIHQSQLNWKYFSPPPLKKFYDNKKIVFPKPTVVITNRKNSEWNGEPINFINGDTLRQLVDMLKTEYQIVYLDAASFGSDYEDHASFDDAAIDELDGVLTLKDLRILYPEFTINELQCRLYAGCNRFISSNGGLGILCSYFGGENIIFTKMCRETDVHLNSFHAWYFRFSGASISVPRTEAELLELVEEKWVKKKPLFNVIIRTHNRPNFFHDCIKSVYDQDYTNYNIYVAVDGARSLRYVCGHQCAILGVGQPSEAISDKPEGVEYGEWYPANLCYSRILRFIRTGYVLYLDDDACLANPHAMSMIANAIEQSKSEVVFWRVVFSDSVVPDEVGWEKRSLALGNVVSSGYCHSVHLTPSWEPWRHAGYRTAEYLTEATKKITWLDAQTVRVQRRRKEDSTVHDKAGIVVSHYTNVVVAIAAHNAAETLERCLDSVWMNRCGNTFRVLVGIDGCAETLALARKLTRKYQGQFEFFHTGARNKGTYVVRNALLMKVILRDSLVFFLDADDVLPDGFIPFYLNEYNSLAMEKGFNGALQARMCSINDREIQLPSANEFDHLTSQTAVSTESFFCSLEALKHMGLFNEFRVAQGADFLERIRLAGIGVHFVDNGPYFIKAVREKSLSNHHALGIGTPERKNIVAENQKRIEQGIILADAICTKLSIVL